MAAHRIGSAAFFAPEMRISPDSGTPPLINSLSIALPLSPFFRSEGLHGQRVNFLAHAIAQHTVYQLVPLHARLAAKRLAHDDGFEVLTIANHLEILTWQLIFDVTLDVFWSNHGSLLN